MFYVWHDVKSSENWEENREGLLLLIIVITCYNTYIKIEIKKLIYTYINILSSLQITSIFRGFAQ